MIKIMKRMKVNFNTRYSLHKGGLLGRSQSIHRDGQAGQPRPFLLANMPKKAGTTHH